MIITTTPTIEGRPIQKYLGIVTGEAILGANIVRDLFASITDIVGGRSAAYEEELRRARQIALQEMADEAVRLGGNAVVGVDLDYGARRDAHGLRQQHPHPGGEMPIVETRGLTKIYRMGHSEIRAVDGIDLTLAKGEFISVMGRSGSGKSTLLNLIGCLDRPTAGSVTIAGVEVSRLPARELPRIRREKVGFVFQQFNLLPTLTALENVELPLRYSGVSGRERRQRAKEAMEQVGLAERLDHRPSELSGGECQRVAIARAIINQPAIILADEPTGELDTHTATEIITLMQELNRAAGVTVIIVTHDPLVAQRTDRIIHLQDGRIISEERPR